MRDWLTPSQRWDRLLPPANPLAGSSVAAKKRALRKTCPTISIIDPLRDPRWGELADRHPRASVFHTPGWLEALRRTYGYRPIVFSTSAPNQDLRNGLLFCQVESFLTGRRLVSLPFADHCDPLVDSPKDFEALLVSLQQDF